MKIFSHYAWKWNACILVSFLKPTRKSKLSAAHCLVIFFKSLDKCLKGRTRMVYSYVTSGSRFCAFARLNSIPCLFLLAAIGLTTGCGSNPSTPKVPQFTGNTAVTLLLSSTANGQLLNYQSSIQSLTLTSQSGKIVTLIASPQPTEFVHLNGLIEPYGTVTVPPPLRAYMGGKQTIGG